MCADLPQAQPTQEWITQVQGQRARLGCSSGPALNQEVTTLVHISVTCGATLHPNKSGALGRAPDIVILTPPGHSIVQSTGSSPDVHSANF